MKKYRKYIIWLWLIFVGGLCVSVSLIWMIASGYFGSLPTFEELENPKSNLASEVYSADDQILGKYFIQNRSNVGYDELSHNLVNALVATEDIRFVDHSGVDLRGLMRVLVKTILFQQGSGGGSTITQQLAKNLFPRDRLSKLELVVRKIKEWVIAVKLERNYTKKEILSMYLNTVPFGSNSFGIKSATKTFYNTTQDSLTIDQAAVLVGLLKAPSWYSPLRNEERSTKRRNTVLSQMRKYDFISQEELDSLVELPIALEYSAQNHQAGLATYFREYLRGQLTEWCKNQKKPDGTVYNLYQDGLKIYTTINSTMQQYAEEAVAEHLGGELQEIFFRRWKGAKNAPFYRLSKKQINSIMDQAKKGSMRYLTLTGKACANCGRRGKYIQKIKDAGIQYFQCRADDCQNRSMATPEDSIDVIFNRPVRMKVFSWAGDVDTVLSPMDSILYYKYFLHTGVMSMEPGTGYVRAWVGGINYKHFQFDHVKLSKRQVGSTFKPFVYALAMQEKWSPCRPIQNVPVTFNVGEFNIEKSWTPRNSDDKYDDLTLSLSFGLANSINRMTAFIMKQFGPDAVVNLAHQMGITSYLDPQPALCLGSSDLTVYEMVGAYGTFANKGVWTEPIIVTRIEDNKGNVIEDFIPERREAMSEETATLMLNMLMGVITGVHDPEAQRKTGKRRIGSGVRLGGKYKLYNQIAGKTGTTQNYSDGWFMGITPNLVTGVWVGCEDRAVHFRRMFYGQGANMALPIWALYMKKVYANNSLGVTQSDKFELVPTHKLDTEIDCDKYRRNHSTNYEGVPQTF